jgi:hypothetical protein
MQTTLVIGGVVLVLVLVALWVIVSLAKSKGAAAVWKDTAEADEKRRRDADEIMVENVADEVAWLERQLAESPSSLARARLRIAKEQAGTARRPDSE